jgi:hypothetical protein
MTFTNRVTAITQDVILPQETDNFFGDTSFLPYRFLGNGEQWGGETLKVPVTIGANNNGGSFQGMSSVQIGVPQTRVQMQYNVKAHRQSITIPGLEKLANKGEERIVNLVSADLHTAFESMLERVSIDLYGDGTGNNNQAFNGLNNLTTDTTIATTIGGLSRSTYSTLNGHVTDVGGAISLDDLASFSMDLRSGSGMKNKPTAYICGETVWNYLEKLIITGTVQANYQAQGYPTVTRNSKGAIRAAELSGGYGFDSIIYRTIPIVFDESCPANVLFGLNENYLKFYGASSEDLKSITIPQALEGTANDRPTDDIGLQWSGWKDAYAEFGELAVIYLFGEFITTQPRRMGKLINITGV